METDDLMSSERIELSNSSAVNNERVIFVDPQSTVVGAHEACVPYNTPDPHEELQRILGGSCSDISVKESEYSENIAIDVDLNPVKNENHQVDADSIPGEEIMEKLQDVAQFVQDHFPGQVQCLLMYDVNQMPFLTIISDVPDPYLVDRSALTLNCLVDHNLQVISKLLTFNRNVIDEVVTSSQHKELLPLLQNLVGNRYRVCVGFREEDHAELFARMKKLDFFNVSIGRFSNDLIFRARMCNYLVQIENENEEESNHCDECKQFFTDLDHKYFHGKYSQPPSLVVPIPRKDDKRKRGRPKGSKNKNFVGETEQEMNVDQETGKVEIKREDDEHGKEVENETVTVLNNIVVEGDDTALLDDPTDLDYKQGVRRGIRKRITTNRQRALLELSKRKRGRPPIATGPFHCSECGLKMTVLKDYRKHCLEHTNSFACGFGECDRRFKCEKDLEVHTRKHKGEKPYVCNECDKAYQIRQDLKLHMRKHTGDRPYKCEVCLKSFARTQQLKIHQAVHTGERAFLCSECGASFGSVSTMIDHRKRRHLLMRNFKCIECHKAFFTRQELTAHQRTHTGDKPFHCTDCGKNFARTHHLKRHIAGVHHSVPHSSQVTTGYGHATTYLLSKDDIEEGDENQVLGVGATDDGETVLVTADNSVLVRQMGDEDQDDELIQTEYVVQGGFSPMHGIQGDSLATTTQLLIQKARVPPSGCEQVQYLQLTRDDQHGEGGLERTLILQQDTSLTSNPSHVDMSSVDMTGVDEGGYVLITTNDNQQKLVPVAQFVSVMQQQHQQQHQQ